jgi:O-succinylbenzoate synthase
MYYKFSYRPYQRHFRQPLVTHHQTWTIREGIILCLADSQGNKGWGEVAPIPWFGCETLTQALAFCQQLGETITEADICTIPDSLPACQFGFESALQWLSSSTMEISNKQISKEIKYCYLLPTGKQALHVWENIYKLGLSDTFKWKIGVNSLGTEIEIFKQLTQRLPSAVKLRLDANGGLNVAQARQWLTITDKMTTIEFLEQPLPCSQLEMMLQLSQEYQTPLALDESVANLAQLEKCYQQGWRNIFIIKAAIAGSPHRLREFIRKKSLNVVFSSVFETQIGQKAALDLAQELSSPNYALGFGIDHWFKEDDRQWLTNLLHSF